MGSYAEADPDRKLLHEQRNAVNRQNELVGIKIQIHELKTLAKNDALITYSNGFLTLHIYQFTLTS